MKKRNSRWLSLILLLALIMGCKQNTDTMQIDSPGKVLQLAFELQDGVPFYSVNRNSAKVIKSSKLGFKFKDLPALDGNFVIKNHQISTFDETWEQPWGEKREIRNNYTELFIELEQNDSLKRK